MFFVSLCLILSTYLNTQQIKVFKSHFPNVRMEERKIKRFTKESRHSEETRQKNDDGLLKSQSVG
jgi:hypothetical protein